MKRKHRGYWTKKRCQKEAFKFKIKSEFRKKSMSTYSTAAKNGWLDEICSHMESKERKPRGYWTKENCVKEALKYETKLEFYKKSGSAYSFALKNDLISEICSHMREGRKPNDFWTFERCKEESSKYEYLYEFENKYPSAYNKIRKNNWFQILCSHMKKIKKPNGYWTKERCQEEALKSMTRWEFQKKSISSYLVSKSNGWLDEMCSHMKDGYEIYNEKRNIWTYERCKEEASKYKTKIEFLTNCNGAYQAAKRNGWHEELCSHMNNKKVK